MTQIVLSFLLFLPVILNAAAESQPFRWSASSAGNRAEIRVVIAPGAYLNWDDVRFDVTDERGPVSAPASVPAPRLQKGENGLTVPVLTAGEWRWVFRGEPPFRVAVEYQGCTVDPAGGGALCLMPEREILLPRPEAKNDASDSSLPAQIAGALPDFQTERILSGLTDAVEFLRFLQPDATPEQSAPAASSVAGFLWMALAALLGGIALNLTPCVLPMIPINLAILGGGEQLAGRSGFFRGLAYGCGITAAYGILGLAVILGGARFGTLNAYPAFNFAVALLFFWLALAAAGVFPLDFTRFGRVRASRLPGGAHTVAFLLGAVAALLAGACVAPVVVSVLLFSAEQYRSGNGFALFLPLLLGAGMGLPWPLAGAGLGVLPKPGRYMIWIKYAFAALIAAAGVYYAGIGWNLLRRGSGAEFQKLATALARSRAERTPVLLDFGASWCKNCKAMERDVLARPEVQKAMKDFIVCKFQADDLNNPRVRALLDYFQLPGLPGFVILRPR